MKNLPVVIMIIILIIIPGIYGKYDYYKKITELQNEQIICLENSIKEYREFYNYCPESDFSNCIYEQINSNERSIKYCQDNYNSNYWHLIN